MVQVAHVIGGASAAGALRQALGDSSDHVVIGLRDVLSCGPLTKVTSLAEWAELRARFWNEVLAFDDIQVRDFVADVPLLENASAIHLWLGNGLGEQLTLLWFPGFLRLLAIDVDRLRVIQFPHTSYAPTLGVLNKDQLLTHPPPVALTSLDLVLIDRGWAAVLGDTPDELRAFLASLPRTHPFRTLARLLMRYPYKDTGLGYWDHELLLNTREHGPKASRVMGHTLVAPGSDADPMGDGWLFWRLCRLGDPAMPFPLVRLEGNLEALRTTSVHLTDAGRRVLENGAHAVQLNGIDDWVAGVHLESAANRVWFWDGEDLVAS